jgi:hypothetical protein
MPSDKDADRDKDSSKSSQNESSKRNKQPTEPDKTVSPMQRLGGEFLGATLLVLFHAGIAASSRVLQLASGQPKTGLACSSSRARRASRSSPSSW